MSFPNIDKIISSATKIDFKNDDLKNVAKVIKKSGINISGLNDKQIKNAVSAKNIKLDKLADKAADSIKKIISQQKKSGEEKFDEKTADKKKSGKGFLDGIFKKFSVEYVAQKFEGFVNQEIKELAEKEGIKIEKIAETDPKIKNKFLRIIKGTYRVEGLDKAVKKKLETEAEKQLKNAFDRFVDPMTSRIVNIDMSSQALKPLNDAQKKLNALSNQATSALTQLEKINIAQKLSDSVLGKIHIKGISDEKLQKFTGKLLNSSAFKNLNSKITGTVKNKITPLVTKYVGVMQKVSVQIEKIKTAIVKYEKMVKEAIQKYVDKAKQWLVDQTKKIIGDIASKIGSSISFKF